MTVKVPLVPHLETLCEEAIDCCGCPIQGIVLRGGFVANVCLLSDDPLLWDPTFEQASWAAAMFLSVGEEICSVVETDQFARNCGGVAVAAVATACGGS